MGWLAELIIESILSEAVYAIHHKFGYVVGTALIVASLIVGGCIIWALIAL